MPSYVPRNIPDRTADNIYKYNKSYYNKPLDWWIQSTHKCLAINQKWSFRPLKTGSYGYDGLAHSIGFLFNNMKFKKKNIDDIDPKEVASLVHDGWCCNYFHWRENKPYKTNKKVQYIKPGKVLGDERREKLAYKDYDSLHKEDKKNNNLIARHIIKIIKKELM